MQIHHYIVYLANILKNDRCDTDSKKETKKGTTAIITETKKGRKKERSNEEKRTRKERKKETKKGRKKQ